MPLRHTFSRFALALFAFAGVTALCAQQPLLPLPNTATTVAGGAATSSGTAAAPVACSTGSQYKSVDSFGNNCPGLNANFSADTRGGIASDGQGNIYIADTSNSMIRKYDPRTGLVTRVAGKGTNCATTAGLQDGAGDGCPALQTIITSTPRGIGTDPYGNVLFAGYGSQMVHIICNAASPLCPNTANHKQIGSMYRLAGCVGTAAGNATAGSGTTAGSEGDGAIASPFNNLAGDVADWGAGSTGNGTCSATVGELNQPRGVAADKWGNVYIGETAVGRWRVVLGPRTSTFFTGTNPLFAVIALNPTYAATGSRPPQQGYIYPLLNGFVAQTSSGITYNIPAAIGGACQSGTGASSATATDTVGDGCQYFSTAASTNTGSVQGIAVDSFGNVIFADALNSRLRVLYAGGASASANPLYAALVANGITTPTAGFVYSLAGGGTTSPSATPTLGASTLLSNGIYKVAVGPGGNLYFGDSNGGGALFFDISTGYLRSLFKSGTACSARLNSVGDGCPAGGFTFSASNGFGVAPDPLGNLYVLDQNALLRKIEAVSLVPSTVGAVTAASAPLTQNLVFHAPVGTASVTAVPLASSADITVGTVTSIANADGTLDTTVPVTFAPAQPGQRTLNLAVLAFNSGGTVLASGVFPVSATATGSALVTDLASPATSTLSTAASAGLALDGAGNLYTVNTSTGSVLKVPASGSAVAIGTAPANLNQIAVDTVGNVYLASTGTASLTKLTLALDGTYTAGTVTTAGVTAPQAVAVDPTGNLFLADNTTGSVYEVAAGSSFSSSQPLQTLASGFTNPSFLSLDGQGNLFVADKGANAVYKVAVAANTLTKTLYVANSGSPTITVASLTPSTIASDAAGNLYIQDSTAKSLTLIPVNQTGPSTVAVLGGITTPTGVAVDGNGAVYSLDAVTGAITRVARNAVAFNFGTSTTTVFTGTVSNAGNLTATGFQTSGQDSAEFPLTSVSPSNCAAATSIIPGYSCTLSSQFTPTSGTGTVSSTLAYTVASSTTGSLVLSGTKTGAAVTTTTTVGTQSPATPVYSASASEVSFPVTVSASDSSTPTGYINVTLDSGSPVAYTLSGGAVTVSLSGLSAGTHTLLAAYPTQTGLTGSTSSTITFSIAQASTSVSWTPGATTQQFSAALGAAVLNATATSAGSTVPGYFLYTATPSGGSARTVHSASYLAIGTYSLAVTFVPADSTDYTGSNASVASYTVTKASTTAALGATQMLVATDGTGNFTGVQAAVNALPSGGSIYIKPGTYTGNIAVVQPNISFRGLGGDPTAVVLTHSGGAFGGTGTYAYAGEFNSTQTNGYQLPSGSSLFSGDEGAATLVVDKGINTAISSSTLTPNNFYAENVTVQNTYNTDTGTTTSTYVSGGNCIANAGPARTYNDLYNNNLQCASQALALWTRSDISVFNNVYFNSLQDTIYSGSQGSGSSGYVPARQYYFRGKVTGNVDYIFGDSASVWDYTTFFTPTRSSATIEAQNKAVQTGATGDYLSGYVQNNNILTSGSSTGMSGYYYGRPYGKYSTAILLNSAVDQINPLGWSEFTGLTNLPTSTYAEFGTTTYTDPAVGAADANGVLYGATPLSSATGALTATGGNTGTGVTGTRETTSQSPGTPFAANTLKTLLTAAQATLYYPTNFLSATVSNSSTGVTNWTPTATLASKSNAFATDATASSVTGGTSVTLLMRPATPGLGALTNGSYTVPTGTYTLTDTYNGASSTLASGTLDSSGAAYLTTSSLPAGQHSLTWTYSGDASFTGSTSSAYTLTVTGTSTVTTLSATANPIVYGQTAAITATVSASAGTPTGSVTLTVDGGSAQTVALSSGQASFSVAGLSAGTHSLVATYSGATTFTGSVSTALSLTVNKATLSVFGICNNRLFDQPNNCSVSVSGYQGTDTAATVLSSGPTVVGTATRVSPPGAYSTVPSATLSTAGAVNYTLNLFGVSYNVTGNVPQVLTFGALPALPPGTYQLSARASSGLAVTYTVSGPASISGSTLTVSGAGTVTVTAAQAGNSTYAAATAVSRSFVTP